MQLKLAVLQNDPAVLGNLLKDLPASEEGRQTLNWALFQSIINRNQAMVHLLLEAGAQHELSQSSFPLVLAPFELNFPEVLDTLIQFKVNFHCSGAYGNVLHPAARLGNERMLKRLLDEFDLDVNARNADLETPLMVASKFGFDKCVRLLLERKSDTEATDNNGNCALHLAVARGHFSSVQELLLAGADSMKQDSDGDVPWVIALKHHQTFILHLLETHGARPKTGELLHLAAKYGNVPVVEMLLREGLSPSELDQDGRTPLMVAVQNKTVGVIVKLLDACPGQCGVHLRDKEGHTAVQIALNKHPFTIFESLIMHVLKEKGSADVDLIFPDGQHPLVKFSQDPAKVKALVQCGANLNVLFEDGEDLLDRTISWLMEGHEKVLELMLEHNLNIFKPQGATSPLIKALSKPNITCAKMLFHSDIHLGGVKEWMETAQCSSVCATNDDIRDLCWQIARKVQHPLSLKQVCRSAILGSLRTFRDAPATLKTHLPTSVVDFLRLKPFQLCHEQCFS